MIDYKFLAKKEQEIADKYDNVQPPIIEELKEIKSDLQDTIKWVDYSIEVREQKFSEEMDKLMEGIEK
jgi:hypothetical protein